MEYETASTDELFKNLQTRADLVFQFAVLYADYLSEKHDYGTGELINMVEVHTLTAIEENPGITVTELARYWNRTKGAISQTVTRLENKGYVLKQKHPTNAKSVLLYPTQKGKELSYAHKAYDIADVTMTMQELMKTCTAKEIDSFFKVIACYNRLLNDE